MRALHAAKDAFDALAGRGPHFTHQSLGDHVDPSGIEGYYCDLRHKGHAAAESPHGIYGAAQTREPVVAVIDIAQAGLGWWELRYDGERTDAEFLGVAEWLVEHAEETPAGLAWRSDFPVPKYGLEPGWTSAMGQSEAISVLVRAHKLSGEERYLATATAALPLLETPVERGGVSRRVDGQLVLEEYPSARPAAVLNGWIFALFGVHELANATGDERPRALFEESFEGLIELLPRYDCGWWSLYSLYDHGRPDLAKPFYQRLHPVLLRALHMARPDERLIRMAERWERQLTTRATLRNSANKLWFRAYRGLRDRR